MTDSARHTIPPNGQPYPGNLLHQQGIIDIHTPGVVLHGTDFGQLLVFTDITLYLGLASIEGAKSTREGIIANLGLLSTRGPAATIMRTRLNFPNITVGIPWRFPVLIEPYPAVFKNRVTKTPVNRVVGQLRNRVTNIPVDDEPHPPATPFDYTQALRKEIMLYVKRGRQGAPSEKMQSLASLAFESLNTMVIHPPNKPL